MDAVTQAWLDQQDADLAATIRRRGWSIQYIGGDTCSAPGCNCPESDGPPFAYTVGSSGCAPGVAHFRRAAEIALGVLNALGRGIKAGNDHIPGRVILFEGHADWPHRIIPEEVPNPGEIVFRANQYYRRPDEYSVPVLQLSYDDEEGRFPWKKATSLARCNPDRVRSRRDAGLRRWQGEPRHGGGISKRQTGPGAVASRSSKVARAASSDSASATYHAS